MKGVVFFACLTDLEGTRRDAAAIQVALLALAGRRALTRRPE